MRRADAGRRHIEASFDAILHHAAELHAIQARRAPPVTRVRLMMNRATRGLQAAMPANSAGDPLSTSSETAAIRIGAAN
jgi:hypothetical protein